MKRNLYWPAFRLVVLTLLLVGLSGTAAEAAATQSPLLAYIGPGAGLGFLGSLFAVLMVLLLGLVGLILYPLKLAIRWLRRSRPSTVAALGSDSLARSQQA